MPRCVSLATCPSPLPRSEIESIPRFISDSAVRSGIVHVATLLLREQPKARNYCVPEEGARYLNFIVCQLQRASPPSHEWNKFEPTTRTGMDAVKCLSMNAHRLANPQSLRVRVVTRIVDVCRPSFRLPKTSRRACEPLYSRIQRPRLLVQAGTSTCFEGQSQISVYVSRLEVFFAWKVSRTLYRSKNTI